VGDAGAQVRVEIDDRSGAIAIVLVDGGRVILRPGVSYEIEQDSNGRFVAVIELADPELAAARR
jgi:hypothetical protein